MKITKIGFPAILSDNDMKYLSEVFLLIKSIDDECEMVVCKTLSSYSFTIIPSDNSSRKKIIVEVSKFHKKLSMLIEFSRSLKISQSITFFLV